MPDEINWQVERLRFTAFVNPKDDLSIYKRWEELVGAPPDEASFNRKEQFAREQGSFNEHRLIVQIQPFRYDWLLVKPSSPEGSMPNLEFPIIGPFDSEFLNPFCELMVKWLDGADFIERIAFGTILLSPVSDQGTGYQLIDGLLPEVTVRPDSSDFLFQINRPRPSRVGPDGLVINRLARWSVARLYASNVELMPGKMRYADTESSTACRLELDVNTSNDFEGGLPSGRFKAIFNELVELSMEIASEGDIP